MFLIKYIFIIYLLSTRVNHAKYVNAAGPVISNATSAVQMPQDATDAVKCDKNSNSTRSPPLKINLPFMDMTVENERNLIVMQEQDMHSLYVLHGHELFHLVVGQKEKRISRVAFLSGSVEQLEPLDATVITWHKYLIIAVALADFVEIYGIPLANIQSESDNAKNNNSSVDSSLQYEPIQQLTVFGKYRKAFLIEPQKDSIMLILITNTTRLNGIVRTFVWQESYFDPIEELPLPPAQKLFVVGTFPKYFITGKTLKHQPKTILNIYEIEQNDMHLRKSQVLTVNSRSVLATTYRSNNFIVACSREQKKCPTFRMKDGQFNVFKSYVSAELKFDKLVGGLNFLVAARLNEILIYTNIYLNCYSTFITNETDITTIITHTNNHDENYLILVYKRPLHTLIRMIHTETNDGQVLGKTSVNATDIEDIDEKLEHQHVFEDTIGRLRSLLLRRRAAMNVFRRVASVTQFNLTELKVNNTVKINTGHINVIKIVDENLITPSELLKRAQQMTEDYVKSRKPRSVNISQNDSVVSFKFLKVKNITVENLLYEGDLLEGFSLDNSTGVPILSVKPHITTKNINSPIYKCEKHNIDLTQGKDSNSTVLKTRKLNVKTINGIPWSTLYDSFFLKNRDTKIDGQLTFQGKTKVVNLWTETINGLVTDDLFNLKHPQVVNSNITISRFLVKNLTAEKVNGLDFAEDIVFRGRDTLIETPVRINQVEITGNLYIADNKEPVVDEILLQQYYTKKVTINGSLTINNLNTDFGNTTKIFVDGKPLSREIIEKTYFLHNQDQIFDTPVVFGNAKVTVPHLETKYLNNHPVHDHLLRSEQPVSKKPYHIIFMSAIVNGNITYNSSDSRISKLDKQSIRYGESANITGHKIFEAPVTVDHLLTLKLNELPVEELVLDSQLENNFTLGGVKSFEKVTVLNDVYIEKELNTNYLNNVPLDNLLSYDYYMDKVFVPHDLNVSNIVFHKLNDVPFDDIFNKFHVKDDQLVLHKDLIVEGNVEFVENLEVSFINNIDWESYSQSLVRVNENAVLYGQKRFLSDVTVTESFQTPTINGVDLDDVFSKILLKSKPQIITGAYTFSNAQFTNVDVPIINDVPTDEFIDIREEKITIFSDIVVPMVTVNGNMSGEFVNPFNLSNIIDRVKALPTRPWRNLVVRGSAKWNKTTPRHEKQYEQLLYLYKNAVKRSADQIITGNVKMSNVYIKKINTKSNVLQDIDFDFLTKDCLYKNSNKTQHVLAPKIFIQPLEMKNAVCKSLLNVNYVNGVNIALFNSSLYRKSSGLPISAPLYFKTTPTIERLNVEGLVNGKPISQIYEISHPIMPPVFIQNVTVNGTLQIINITVDNVDFDDFLSTRVLKPGISPDMYGALAFKNLVLSQNVKIKSINNISINSFDQCKSEKPQEMTGTKIIEGETQLLEPVHVQRLNGKDSAENYKLTLFANKTHYFDSFNIDEATFKGSGMQRKPNDFVGAAVPGLGSISNTMVSSVEQKMAEKTTELEKVETATAEVNELSSFVDGADTNKLPYLRNLGYDLQANVYWHAANETIDKLFQFELTRLSFCERQILQVQISSATNNVYLTNITTKLVTTTSSKVSIKAENYCVIKYKNIRSKITLTTPDFVEKFGMKKFVENVFIHGAEENISFALIHGLNADRNINEVRVLKIEKLQKSLKDWQTIKNGIGGVLKFFQHNNHTLLLSAAVVDKRRALSIYVFIPQKEKFSLLQVINGEYDIIEPVVLSENTSHFILSCQLCQRVFIYEWKLAKGTKYEILQELQLDSPINKIFTFHLATDGGYYLLILPKTGLDRYHLYKYSYIQNWEHYTSVDFHNVSLAVPLSNSDLSSSNAEQPLLLLCDRSSECNIVKAYIKDGKD